MSSIEKIMAAVVEQFSEPRDCTVVKIRENGREDVLGVNLTWDDAEQLAETIIPTLKRGERLSIRERPRFEPFL